MTPAEGAEICQQALHTLCLVLRQVGVMVLIGGVIGLAGAIALGRAARSMLFGISGADPVVMIGSAGLLALVALAAGYVPARRASRVDPM